ncbi:hypothetical protein RclHR1_01320004 [Rhizophagus clarus]|uniref:F-box domain-containing protein n=1 Tax=Rhizophagus clarus TaxID=94130 RepID=A0A2Z6QLU0_9GLOM|nr:hypothetical protein RclHR1_01320004 [Rhizophagus clarus]GES81261.1 hypothetical protein GLOIN_2v1470296 [Rhizophagus clarus]
MTTKEYDFTSELLSEIFEHLQIPELFKCISVNKKWGANAVRILWRNPIEFANLNLTNSKLSKDESCLNIISTMIKCLPLETKIKIRAHGINFDELKEGSQPMFDYCSSIKKITYDMIFNATNILFNSLVEKSIIIKDQTCHYIVFQEICNFLVNKCVPNLDKKVNPKFILNAYNPKQIGSCNKRGSNFPLPSHLPQMKKSLSLLEKFNLNTCIQPRFIQELDEICKNILSIGIYCGCCDEFYLAEFIKNQLNLQEIYVMSMNNFHLIKISEAIRNKLEQLSSLTISTGQISLNIFNNRKCDQLIELNIHNFCDRLADINEWNDFFRYNTTSFKNLKILELQSNIKNFKYIGIFLHELTSLRNLELAWSEDEEQILNETQDLVDELFQNISKSCSNLIQLELSTPKFTQSLEIILLSCKKLEYLNLLNTNNSNDLNEKIFLLGQHFPMSLKKFGVQFYLNISKEKLEEFLNNCFMNGIRNLSLGFYIEGFSTDYEIIMKKYVKLGTLNNEFFKSWLEFMPYIPVKSKTEI